MVLEHNKHTTRRFPGTPGVYHIQISLPAHSKPHESAKLIAVALWEGCHSDGVDEDDGDEVLESGCDSEEYPEVEYFPKYSHHDEDRERDFKEQNEWYQDYVDDDHSR